MLEPTLCLCVAFMVISPQDAKRHSPSRSRQAALTDRERWTDGWTHGREVLSARHLKTCLEDEAWPAQTPPVADMPTSTKAPENGLCAWFGNGLAVFCRLALPLGAA